MSEYITEEVHKEFATRVDAENQMQNKRIDKLEETVKEIQRLTIAVERIDQLGRQTEAITPKQYTKTAYIEDTEVVFSGVSTGNMTVYCSVPHTVERDGDRVAVHFEPLEEVTEVTISII